MPKEKPEYAEPIDPYTLMKQQYEFLLQRLDIVESKQDNLQAIWERILTVQEQPSLRQYQVPPYQPPQYQQPSQPYVPQQPYLPPIQMPTEDKPKWEKEAAKVEVKPKKKGFNKLLVIGGLVLLFMVYMWYASSHGWSCAIGG